MKTRIFTITSTLILTLFSLSIAEAASGLKNQKIFVGTSARALGMGSAFTAGPAASDSSFWNPSSLGFLKGTELSLVGLPFADESQDREAAFSLALNPWKMGITTSDVGNFSIASWFDGWGNDNETNRVMLFGYGRSLGNGIATGANIRHHRRNRALSVQIGWSLDLGLLYSRKLQRLGEAMAVGLSIENIGGGIREEEQISEKMPLVARLGTTYHLDTDTILSGDIVLHNDKEFEWRDRFRAHLGAERWIFDKRLGVRVGYTAIASYNLFTEGEWSRGFSLSNDTGQLDYAYVSGDNLDGGVHWISATLRWGASLRSPIIQPPIVMTEEVPLTEPTPIIMPKPQPQHYSLEISEAVISPNGDGVKDLTVFDFEVSEDEAWQLELRDNYDEVVQIYSGTGLPMKAMTWDGRDAEENLVSDGIYVAQLITFDEQENRHPHQKTDIVIDTIPAELDLSAEPLILVSKNGDTTEASLGEGLVVNMPTVHVRASDLNHIEQWELLFFDGAGEVIDERKGKNHPPNTIVWNDWQKYKLRLKSDADYRCALTVYDFGGNRTTQETPLAVVDLRQKDQTTDGSESITVHQEERGIVLTLPGVAFDTNSYEIRSEYRLALEETAEAIAIYPDAQILVEGHTDNMGESSYNLELSRKRANAVMTYLVNEFAISPPRLSAIGYGEDKPIIDNNTEANRSKNRRVEIVLLTVEDSRMVEAKQKVQTGALLNASAVQKEIEVAKWTLLVSSFKNRKNATLLVESLEALNLGEEIQLSQTEIRSEPWYRVTIGHFPKREDAAELINELRDSPGIEAILISGIRQLTDSSLFP